MDIYWIEITTINSHLQAALNMGQLYDFEDLSFKSNYYIGYYAQGGMFIIKNEVAVFKAHALNIGDLSEKIIPISEICGYRKGALTTLHIFLFNG